MGNPNELLLANLPDPVTAAEILAAATLDEPVTMRTEPCAHTARHLVRGPANTAATLARNTRNIELLEQLAEQRAVRVRREVATNPATPAATRARVVEDLIAHRDATTSASDAIDQIIYSALLGADELLELVAAWPEHANPYVVECAVSAAMGPLLAEETPAHAYSRIVEHAPPAHRAEAVAAYGRWFQTGLHTDQHPLLGDAINTVEGVDAATVYTAILGPYGHLTAALLDGARRHNRNLLGQVCEHAGGLTADGISWMTQHPDAVDTVVDHNPRLAADIADQLTPDQLVAFLNTTGASERIRCRGTEDREYTVDEQRHIVHTYMAALEAGHSPTRFEYTELEALCGDEVRHLLDTFDGDVDDDIVDKIVTESADWYDKDDDVDMLQRWLEQRPDLLVAVVKRHDGPQLNPAVVRAAATVANIHTEHTSSLCQQVPSIGGLIVEKLDQPAAVRHLRRLQRRSSGHIPEITTAVYNQLVKIAASHPDIDRHLLAWALQRGSWHLTVQLAYNPETNQQVCDALQHLDGDNGRAYDTTQHELHDTHTYDLNTVDGGGRGWHDGALLLLHVTMTNSANIAEHVIARVIDAELDRTGITCGELTAPDIGRSYLVERFTRTFRGDGTAWRTALGLAEAGRYVTPATIEHSVLKLSR